MGSLLRIEERTYRQSLTTDANCQTLHVLQVKLCTSYRDNLMVTTMSDIGSLTGEIMYVHAKDV